MRPWLPADAAKGARAAVPLPPWGAGTIGPVRRRSQESAHELGSRGLRKRERDGQRERERERWTEIDEP